VCVCEDGCMRVGVCVCDDGCVRARVREWRPWTLGWSPMVAARSPRSTCCVPYPVALTHAHMHARAPPAHTSTQPTHPHPHARARAHSMRIVAHSSAVKKRRRSAELKCAKTGAIAVDGRNNWQAASNMQRATGNTHRATGKVHHAAAACNRGQAARDTHAATIPIAWHAARQMRNAEASPARPAAALRG
jgi:hypothetical protein